MSALLAIGWVLRLFVSVVLCLDLIGMRSMCSFFPEGRRWWMLPAQLAALAHFAAAVRFTPWGYPR